MREWRGEGGGTRRASRAGGGGGGEGSPAQTRGEGADKGGLGRWFGVGGPGEPTDKGRAGGGGVRGADEEVVSLLAHLERRRQPRHQQAATPPFPDPHHIHRQARPPRTSLASVPFPQHALATPPPPTPANTSLDTRPFRYHTSHPTTHELRSFPLYRRRILCAAAFSRVAARCRLRTPGCRRRAPAAPDQPPSLAACSQERSPAARQRRCRPGYPCRQPSGLICAVSGDPAPSPAARQRPRSDEDQRGSGPADAGGSGPADAGGSDRRSEKSRAARGVQEKGALLFSPQEGSLRRADRGAGGGWQQGHFL